jgi:hypothetical protein
MRLAVLTELIRKSGVREWDDVAAAEKVTRAAVEIADFLVLAPDAEWDGETGANDMTTRKILIPEMDGTPKQIWFATSGATFTAGNDLRDTTSGNRTEVALTFNAIANSSSDSTGARQSAKVDLGTPRAAIYDVFGALSWQATPTSGAVLEVWWNPSLSATAATANVGGCSGSDASYTGYSSNIAASLRHLQYVGEFLVGVAGTGIQQARIGSFSPLHRYGSLVAWNKGGSALTASNNELHIVMNPRILQGQNEV